MKRALRSGMLLLVLFLSFMPFELRAGSREASFKYELSLSRGIIELDAGRIDAARRAFSDALRIRPGDPRARFNIALCDVYEEKTGEAMTRLRDILADAPDYEEARVEMASLLMEGGDCARAVTILEYAGKEPRSALLSFFLARAYGCLGDVEGAVQLFSRASEMDPRYIAESEYWKGTLYLAEGRRAEAGDCLGKVLQHAEPGSKLYKEAVRLLGLLEKQPAPGRLDVRASARYEYDDNVMLLPDDREIVGISGQDDFRFATTFEVDLVPFAWKYAELSTGYAFYQSVHNRLGDFNLQAHELDGVATFTAGPLRPYCGYAYRYYFLDDNKQSFIRDHELLAGLGFPVGRHGFSMVNYSYTAEKNFLEYAEPGDNRSARNNMLGLDQYLFFGGGERFVRFGFYYDRNDARGSNYTYDGYRLEWELFLPIVWGWEFNGEIEYYIRDFTRNVDDRRDHRREYYARLSRNLNEHMAVGLEFRRIVNESRVELFEFDRNVYSVVADFMF